MIDHCLSLAAAQRARKYIQGLYIERGGLESKSARAFCLGHKLEPKWSMALCVNHLSICASVHASLCMRALQLMID